MGIPIKQLAPQLVEASIGLIIAGVADTQADVRVPFSCEIVGVTLLADVSGSIVIDIWKDTYANAPPTVADTITASAKPTLSSAIKSEDTTLSGWTKTLTKGDVLRYKVDSASSLASVMIHLQVEKA